MSHTSISLVIIHWNTTELLRSLLSSLGSYQGKTTVVDNKSEESLKWMAKEFPSVSLIQNEVNEGYAFAANQGAVESEGKWILFLNPDVSLTEETIREMLAEAEEEGFDACSPLSSTGGYQLPLPTPLSVIKEYTPLKRLFFFMGDPTGRDPKKGAVEPVGERALFGKRAGQDPYLSDASIWESGRQDPKRDRTLFGGCLLIKREVFEDMGGWDERYFLWFEDADLTKRLYESNYSVGWLSMTITHQGGASFSPLSSSKRKEIFFHSLLQYALKHWHPTDLWIAQIVAKHFGAGKLLPVLRQSIDIVIPNRKKELLDKFLKDNPKETLGGEQYTVVTSALKPKEIMAYKRSNPHIRWILLKDNKGFANTVNTGLKASPGDWTGTVNDDVILEKGWGANSVHDLPKDAGSVNPLIYRSDGTIESAGITILTRGKAQPLTTRPNKEITKTDATNGAAVIYSKKALTMVGLFDERFGSYLEDLDLSLRLLRNGFGNYISTRAQIVHLGQSTSKTVLGRRKKFLDFKNWIFLILKNWSLRDILVNFPQILIERGRNLWGIFK